MASWIELVGEFQATRRVLRFEASLVSSRDGASRKVGGIGYERDGSEGGWDAGGR